MGLWDIVVLRHEANDAARSAKPPWAIGSLRFRRTDELSKPADIARPVESLNVGDIRGVQPSKLLLRRVVPR